MSGNVYFYYVPWTGKYNNDLHFSMAVYTRAARESLCVSLSHCLSIEEDAAETYNSTTNS